MGVFDDKKFEELDWISQATEPMDSVMNDVLGAIPEEINIDFDLYFKMVKDSYGVDLDLGRMVNYFAGVYVPNKELSYHQRNALLECFRLEITGEDVILNFEEKSITGGEIRLIKLSSTMDEKVLEGMLGREGVEAVSNAYIHPRSLARANEIMELLTKCEDGLRTRSERKKRMVMAKRLQTLMKSNEWKIKDTELANKVGFWICDYIKDGNMAAFSNFCRLKVMTHKNQPIYSMEEAK